MPIIEAMHCPRIIGPAIALSIGVGAALPAWPAAAERPSGVPAAAPSATTEATTVTLEPAADASIYQGDDGIADGAGPHLWTSVLAIGINRRAMLRFDLTAIPAGAQVQSVSLRLNQSRSRDDHDVSLHRLLAAWSEGPANGGSGGIGAPVQAGDTTWSFRRFPDLRWRTPGGDFVPTPSARRLVGPQDVAYVWTGPGLVDDVQSWVDQPAANHGWLLIGREEGNQVAKRFDSRQNGDPALRPRLTVSYLPPSAAGADADVPLPPWAVAGLAAGLALALARRRPSRTPEAARPPGR